MDIYRLVGPGEMHPRELADMIVRALTVIFEKSRQWGTSSVTARWQMLPASAEETKKCEQLQQ